MPSPPTWCWWLNGTDCVRATPRQLVYGDLCTCSATKKNAATATTLSAMDILEIVFVLRWNTWAIYPPDPRLAGLRVQRWNTFRRSPSHVIVT